MLRRELSDRGRLASSVHAEYEDHMRLAMQREGLIAALGGAELFTHRPLQEISYHFAIGALSLGSHPCKQRLRRRDAQIRRIEDLFEFFEQRSVDPAPPDCDAQPTDERLARAEQSMTEPCPGRRWCARPAPSSPPVVARGAAAPIDRIAPE